LTHNSPFLYIQSTPKRVLINLTDLTKVLDHQAGLLDGNFIGPGIPDKKTGEWQAD
jgi:hypothetical protein